MPSLIHYEGWDGATAPSIPSGWTVSSPLATTASPTGGISPLTNPNVLACAATSTNTHYPATYGVADGNAGDVLVCASVNAASTTSNQTFGIFARGSAYPIVAGSSSFYWAQLSPNGNTVKLYAVVGGMQTTLASVSLAAAFSTDTWYQLQLSCQNSTIAVTVGRASDGYYLNSSGNFQAAGTVAISVTDTSVTGSGYAGLTLQSRSDNAYTDEWYFYSYASLPQAGPIRRTDSPNVRSLRAAGRVLMPLAVRFGTPALSPQYLPYSHGIWCRDPSRRRAAMAPGQVWMPVPARIAPPAQVPFAFWQTVRRLDSSATQRRLAPGRASTPTSFARLAPRQTPRSPTGGRSDGSIRRRRGGGRRQAACGARARRCVPGAQVNEGWTQQYITSVNPPVQYGTELFLSWTSNGPPGLMFQVYENDVLVWHGRSTYCTLPLPQSVVRFDIGTVGFTQQGVSFASRLPPAPRLQAELTWLGGTFEATDITGFHVYGENSPGAGIDYGSILAIVPAYTAAVITDGFGYGGFGQGGFGEAAGSYSWTSGALTSGVWNFAVVPFDTAGNEGTGATVAVLIQAPPEEPAPFSNRSQLQYTWNASDYEITLNWNASPG